MFTISTMVSFFSLGSGRSCSSGRPPGEPPTLRQVCTALACRANALKLLTQQDFKQVVGIEGTRQALTWQTLGTGLLT